MKTAVKGHMGMLMNILAPFLWARESEQSDSDPIGTRLTWRRSETKPAKPKAPVTVRALSKRKRRCDGTFKLASRNDAELTLPCAFQ